MSWTDDLARESQYPILVVGESPSGRGQVRALDDPSGTRLMAWARLPDAWWADRVGRLNLLDEVQPPARFDARLASERAELLYARTVGRMADPSGPPAPWRLLLLGRRVLEAFGGRLRYVADSSTWWLPPGELDAYSATLLPSPSGLSRWFNDSGWRGWVSDEMLRIASRDCELWMHEVGLAKALAAWPTRGDSAEPWLSLAAGRVCALPCQDGDTKSPVHTLLRSYGMIERDDGLGKSWSLTRLGHATWLRLKPTKEG